MTQEEIMEIKKALEKAEESDTPFLVTSEDDVAVAGDTNKTEKHKYDYTMTFVLPKKVDGEVKFIMHEATYKDIYVTPRQNPRIVAIITKLMPFFRKVFPDGTVGDYTNEEAIQLISEWDDDVIDIMYKLVGSVLGVDKSLWDNMRLSSVLAAFVQIVENVPEVVNEADVSFQGGDSPFNQG